MITRRGWILLVSAALLFTVLAHWLLREPPLEPHWSGIWKPRVVEGVVMAGGAPAPGARVQAYEDGGEDDAIELTAGEEGGFRFTWQPRLGKRLYLRASHAGWASTVEAARAVRTTIELVRGVEGRGRVVDMNGKPLPAVRVAVAQAHGIESQASTTDRDGGFVFENLPEGRPLDLLVGGGGLLPYVEDRFVGGDFMVVRAFDGKAVQLDIRDPDGEEIKGARATLLLPAALEKHALPVASESSGRLVEVSAPGFLPVQVEVVPHRPVPVILWPERTVTLRARDSVRKRGVAGLSFEVEIRPERGAQSWRVGIVGGALRRYPVRRGAFGGEYLVRLPACPLYMRLAASGYGDAELTLDAGVDSAHVWMRPLPRRLGGTLELRAPGAPDGFPLVVAAAALKWHRVLRLVKGSGVIEVPPGQRVQIGSLGAWEGFWFPRLDRQAPARGERKSVLIRPLPAVRMQILVQPPVDGTVTLTDLVHEKLDSPLRVPLRGGVAQVWTRPKRDVRVGVTPDTNHFPVTFEVTTEREAFARRLDLRKAAGVRYRIRDHGGNAIPFARVRLWEPGRGGHLELRREPKVLRAAPDGTASFRGLRGGQAAVEISAQGFRTTLFSLLRLEEGKLKEGGDLVLEPSGLLKGKVYDYKGHPAGGVWLRVLSPQVKRLPMPGGGERDLYRLTAYDTGTAATDVRGRFEVPDATPRAPMIACYPGGRPDLVATLLPISERLHLTGAAYVELDVPRSVAGVYLLLDGGRAVLIAADSPMALRPFPVTLPAGPVSLFVRLVNRKWAAVELNLKRGEKARLSPRWNDPVR